MKDGVNAAHSLLNGLNIFKPAGRKLHLRAGNQRGAGMIGPGERAHPMASAHQGARQLMSDATGSASDEN